MHDRDSKMAAFGRRLDIMDSLSEACPWNAAQTFESIRPLTEEEVYELSDAILKGDSAALCKEIGDLLYHLVFYARIAQESGLFDIADSLDRICEKMIFRHPHVFGAQKGEAVTAKEIADTWELVKAREKGGNRTVMSGIPDAMPALLKAMSLQEKARGCGFDWSKREDVWDKVREEIAEVMEACREEGPDAIPGAETQAAASPNPVPTAHQTEEFGDLLFAVINAARL
ncbi:MAG: nucleoside triphosphate pyrophosphohydrolase, partial [Bacteroidales bacterium]|nr:nucleoside triphosphate pyrophosphohydrolase [Bacteroidales bacterium]